MKLEFLGAMGSVGASGISIEDGSDKIVLDYGTKVREVPPKFPLPVERPKAILLLVFLLAKEILEELP